MKLKNDKLNELNYQKHRLDLHKAEIEENNKKIEVLKRHNMLKIDQILGCELNIKQIEHMIENDLEYERS